MEQLRDSPVEEDIDEDEQAVGYRDGEEIGDAAAQGEKFRANGKGSVAVDDAVNTTQARSAAVNQQHVQTKAGIDSSSDVNGAKVDQV